MPTDVQLEQSSAEAISYPLDFSPQLPDGVTLTDVTVTHSPPVDGVTLTIDGTVTGGLGYAAVPEGLEPGVHFFSCVAVTTNPAVAPEILLIVTVPR